MIKKLAVLLFFIFTSSAGHGDGLHHKGLDHQLKKLATNAYQKAKSLNKVTNPHLTIIDYRLPSNVDRMWIMNMQSKQLVYKGLVAHGKGSGLKYPTKFSNTPGTKMSSIGLFVTGYTYQSKKFEALKMHGLEPGINDKAFQRGIVIHGSKYVNQDFIDKHGRIGRSYGCPAVEEKDAAAIFEMIKEGSVILIYYPDEKWEQTSLFI